MIKKNIYFIQDADCPMHVIAESWATALNNWKHLMAARNNISFQDVEEPRGITLVAPAEEVIW